MYKKFLVRFAGTTGFSGYLTKKAPGTVGSIVAAMVFLCLYLTGTNSLLVHAFLIATTFALSVWSGNHADICFDGQADPKELNMDEVCGQFIALLPLTFHKGGEIGMLLLSFLLFRVFDIFKPFPVSYFDRNVKGGFGITMDDVVAGVYALLVLEVLRMITILR